MAWDDFTESMDIDDVDKPHFNEKFVTHDSRYAIASIIKWAYNCFNEMSYANPEAKALVLWLQKSHAYLCQHLDEELVYEKHFENAESGHDDSTVRFTKELWGEVRKTTRELYEKTKDTPVDCSGMLVRKLGKIAKFTQDDIDILELFLLANTQPMAYSFVNNTRFKEAFTSRWNTIHNQNLFLSIGSSPVTIKKRLANDAPLMVSGVFKIDSDGDINLQSHVEALIWETNENQDIRDILLQKSPNTDLLWTDFEHLEEDREYVLKILKGALKNNTKGVNILLYGPNGTGKTEFSKVLANQLQAKLFSVGEVQDGYNIEPDRSDRIWDLVFADNLLKDDHNSLILIDEMDDIFRPIDHKNRGSKVFLNRLLEKIASPAIWTINNIRALDQAVLRRMTYILYMRKPSGLIRDTVLSRQIEKEGIPVNEEEIKRLGRKYDVSPGMAAGAIRAAKFFPEDEQYPLLETSFKSMAKVMDCEKEDQPPPELFQPEFINADCDLVNLADRLTQEDTEKNLSMCLHGPPGTGKSAYVRYLAKRMNMEVIQKRTSDLLSMWVGQSEKNIARAFEEAKDAEAFLIFDEADSLLSDRRGAIRSWEITQVNEMLTQMETHPYPFACTTNFMEKLDSATLRRFLFKVGLNYSTEEQAEGLFRLYFEHEPPKILQNIKALTPGDFPVVLRRAKVTGEIDDPLRLVKMLQEECDMKPNAPKMIGFGSV